MRCDKSADNVSKISHIIVLDPSTYHSIDYRTVAEIQDRVIKKSRRNVASRIWHARNDKEIIAGWKSELNRILVVFNVRSMRSHPVTADSPLFRPNCS